MVRDLKAMDELEIKEKKTGKSRRVSLNEACVEAIQKLLGSQIHAKDDTLFEGRGNEPLTVPSINRLIKQWTGAIKLKGNSGSNTLSKTFCYHQRVTYNVGIPELMVCFNHSTQRQTLEYLCIQPEEIRSLYANEI